MWHVENKGGVGNQLVLLLPTPLPLLISKGGFKTVLVLSRSSLVHNIFGGGMPSSLRGDWLASSSAVNDMATYVFLMKRLSETR